MKIGFYTHWNINWDGRTARMLGCHARDLQGYLDRCDGVRLLTTIQDEPAERNTDSVCDPRLEVVRIPGHSFRTTWLHVQAVRRVVAESLDGLDVMLVRLFDACAWTLAAPCESRGIGMVFLLVGDPVEAFWHRHNLPWIARCGQRMAFLPEEILTMRSARPHTMLICGRDCTNVYGPRHPGPVTVFPSVVSEKEMYPRDDTCTGPRPVILYTGMLRPAKRLETLIDAVGRLIAEGRRLRLRLVGYAEPHDYLATLQQRVAAAGLQESVEFVGYVPLGDPLNREYRGADIYAFPSLHEGAARTLLEAASQSLPLVMTDVGSARDLFADGESALIVPPDDPAAMARAIARYLDEPDLRRRCIRNAYAVAASRSLEKFMDEMTEHLHQAQRRAVGGRHQA